MERQYSNESKVRSHKALPKVQKLTNSAWVNAGGAGSYGSYGGTGSIGADALKQQQTAPTQCRTLGPMC